MTDLRIDEGGLDDPQVIALIELHVGSAREATLAGHSHSFSIERLSQSDMRFFSAWRGDALLGIGALRKISPEQGEIKSMHTRARVRGSGVGAAILERIIAAASADGLGRLSLETHPGAHFAAAVALYAKYGFVESGPFGDHVSGPTSLFMTKELN